MTDNNMVSSLPMGLMQKQSKETKTPSPTLSDRRQGSNVLQTDQTKINGQRTFLLSVPPLERHFLSYEGSNRVPQNRNVILSPLSSAASSMISLSVGLPLESQSSDFSQICDSRRSSNITNRYSLLDALDLEYALISTAARGSIGPYSLSQSMQKLSFTQSLAFPALARGISDKRNSSQNDTRSSLEHLDSGFNAFAKVATVLILVLISVLVSGVLYKFIRT